MYIYWSSVDPFLLGRRDALTCMGSLAWVGGRTDERTPTSQPPLGVLLLRGKRDSRGPGIFGQGKLCKMERQIYSPAFEREI